MKKLLRPLAILLALVLMLSMTAVAAAGDPTVTVETAYKDVVTASFNGGKFESLTVTYQGTAGMTYMCWLLAMDAEGKIIPPTEQNVETVVLDVKDADADGTGKATFNNMIPKTDSMVSCAIAISGMNGVELVKVGEIKVPFTYGDVNDDGTPDTIDAMFIARFAVGLDVEGTFIEAAGDVNLDDSTDTVDSMFIARYAVGLEAKLPIE